MKNKTFSELYTSSKYTQNNPDYHEKDSPHKWRNFETCLRKASINGDISLPKIKSVCEIGCGTGGILKQLSSYEGLNNLDEIEGWDINPSAIEIAKNKYPEIKFFNKDLLSENKIYDLLICADVFEHLENPYLFLNTLRQKSKYFLFNIPIELCFLSMLRGKKIFENSFNDVGHLHFYSAATANLIIELTGYKVIYKKFAKDRTGNYFASPSIKSTIAASVQFIIETLTPYFSTVLMGDHLVLLAESKNN